MGDWRSCTLVFRAILQRDSLLQLPEILGFLYTNFDIIELYDIIKLQTAKILHCSIN